ncbi:MAG: DUF2934 domain-containing protein [Acidobacteria bacterium]|nr:DUF2934 domain-containing protein [Acidobacteriota bacterium]
MKRKQTHSLQPSAPASTARPETQRPDSGAIAALAYRLWQERGCPEGSSEIDWYRAERQLMSARGPSRLMVA